MELYHYSSVHLFGRLDLIENPVRTIKPIQTERIHIGEMVIFEWMPFCRMKIIAVIITVLCLSTNCYCQVEYDTIEKGSQKVCVVDTESPHFPGGISEMMKFFDDNISLPDSVFESASGKVIYLKIAIDTTGKLTRISISKGINKAIDDEVLRIFSIMPKWIPGEKKGKKISEEFVIPIGFE